MSEIRYEAPLKMPEGWVKTPLIRRSYDNNFSRSLTISSALDYLEEEINLLAPNDLTTVYSSYDQIRSERGRRALSKDTGISVQIRRYTDQTMIACDKWALTEHNIYAMSLALRALRSFEPWGIASTSELLRFFSHGSSARITLNEVTTDSLPQWMLKLGLGPTATLEDANAVYRRRAKEIGNDEKALVELNSAMEIARQHLS